MLFIWVWVTTGMIIPFICTLNLAIICFSQSRHPSKFAQSFTWVSRTNYECIHSYLDGRLSCNHSGTVQWSPWLPNWASLLQSPTSQLPFASSLKHLIKNYSLLHASAPQDKHRHRCWLNGGDGGNCSHGLLTVGASHAHSCRLYSPIAEAALQ